MALVEIGTMGTLPLHAGKAPEGFNIPEIKLKQIKVPGTAGQIQLWENYFSDYTELTTSTFCTQDGTSIDYELLVASYVGTPQTLSISNGYSEDDNYTAFIKEAKRTYVACVCSQDPNQDTILIIKWKLILYRN